LPVTQLPQHKSSNTSIHSKKRVHMQPPPFCHAGEQPHSSLTTDYTHMGLHCQHLDLSKFSAAPPLLPLHSTPIAVSLSLQNAAPSSHTSHPSWATPLLILSIFLPLALAPLWQCCRGGAEQRNGLAKPLCGSTQRGMCKSEAVVSKRSNG